MKTGKRIFLAVLAADGLAFLVFLGLAILRRQADLVIPLYASKWQLAEAILGLLPYLPALQFLAIALALGSSKGRADELLRDSILPAILLSALFSALLLLFAPVFEGSRASVLQASARFNRSLEETRGRLDRGDAVGAREAFGFVEAIDRDDPRVISLKERLIGAELKARRESPDENAKAAPARDPAAAKIEYQSALDYLRQGDFYSAHWHASRASELDPSLADARRVEERAWAEILAKGGNAEDRDRAVLFARKMEAFGRLRSGDAVKAYRLFVELSKEAPGDADIDRYLKESLAALQKDAFFKDEADAALLGRVFPSFFVILHGDKGEKIALAAKEITFSSAAAYLVEAEYLQFDAGDRQILHLAIPYAKLEAGRLLLVAVERERPEVVYRPFLPSPPASSQGLPARLPDSLAFAMTDLEAYRLAIGLRLPAAAGFTDLYEAILTSGRFELDARPFILELLRRLGIPFALFAAAILGALVGIRFRSREDRPSRASWLSLPIMTGASVVYFILAAGIDEGLIEWTLAVVPGLGALIASAGLRGLILTLLVLLAAGLGHHDDDAEED